MADTIPCTFSGKKSLAFWIYISQKFIPRNPIGNKWVWVHVMVWRHYSGVIMGALASQITSLTIVYSSFIQTQIKENIKAPRHWSLCEEFTGDRWIPRTNGQLRGKCFLLMTSSWQSVSILPLMLPHPVSMNYWSQGFLYNMWRNPCIHLYIYTHVVI